MVDEEKVKIKKEVKSNRAIPWIRSPIWDARDKLINNLLGELISTLKWIQEFFKDILEPDKEEE
ncbi:hypothetical protein ES702_05200 [subsurface metagenome]